MTLISIIPYLPEIIIGFISLGLLFWGRYSHKDSEVFINILLGIMTVFIFILYGTSVRIGAEDMINVKNLTIGVIGMFSLLLFKAYAGYQIQQNYESPLFLMLVMISAGIAMVADNLLEFYLSLELFSVGLYFLAFYDKSRQSSLDSGVKYWNVSMLSSAAIIFGISLIYGYSDSLNFVQIANLNNNGLIIGISFVMIGILTKIAIVPFHMWLRDVYANIKLPVLSVFAVLGQVTLLVCLNKFNNMFIFNGALAVMAIASMIVGAIGCLYETQIKRILSFLVIMSAGYAMVPIIVSGDNIHLLMAYLASYIFGMTGLIAVLCSFRKGNILIEDIKDLPGIVSAYPIRTFMFFVFLLSICGIPPLAGFFTKFTILLNAFDHQHYVLGSVGLFIGLFNVAFIGKLVKIMVFDKGNVSMSPANMSLKVLVAICLSFVCFFVFLLRHILFFIREVAL